MLKISQPIVQQITPQKNLNPNFKLCTYQMSSPFTCFFVLVSFSNDSFEFFLLQESVIPVLIRSTVAHITNTIGAISRAVVQIRVHGSVLAPIPYKFKILQAKFVKYEGMLTILKFFQVSCRSSIQKEFLDFLSSSRA